MSSSIPSSLPISSLSYSTNPTTSLSTALTQARSHLDTMLAPSPPRPHPSRPLSLTMDGRTLIKNKSSATLEIPAPKTRGFPGGGVRPPVSQPSVSYPSNVPPNLELNRVPPVNPYNSTD